MHQYERFGVDVSEEGQHPRERLSLRPFRALRYDLSRIGNLGAVLGPPDDVSTVEQAQAFARQHPAHCLHLEIPDPQGHSFQQAAARFRSWLQEGLLKIDEEAAAYLYAHRYRWGAREFERYGVFLLAGLCSPLAATLLPHEATSEELVQRREQQLRDVQAHASAVYALWPGNGTLRDHLVAWANQHHCLWELDYAGEQHRLWAITGTQAQMLAAELSDTPLVVADGHHRLEAARRYAQRAVRDDPARHPAAWVPVHVVDAADPALLIRPIHRLLHTLPTDWTEIQERLQQYAPIDNLAYSLPPPHQLAAFVEELEHSPQPQFLLAHRAGLLRVFLPPVNEEPDALLVDQILWQQVCALDNVTLTQMLDYSADTLAVAEALHTGQAVLAVFLRPTSLATVLQWARAGRILPPKTTYFFPKLPQGLVFYNLAQSASLDI